MVVAVLCSRTPPQAVPDLRNVEEEFRLMAQGVKVEEGDVADLQRVIGLNVEEIENRNPIEVFAKVAQHVATPSEPHTKVSIKVELAGPLTLQVNGDGFRGELIFGGDEAEGDWAPGELRRFATLGPKTFAWIGWATMDAGKE